MVTIDVGAIESGSTKPTPLDALVDAPGGSVTVVLVVVSEAIAAPHVLRSLFEYSPWPELMPG